MKSLLPTYLQTESNSRKVSPRKQSKKNVNGVPKTKEQRNLHLPSNILSRISQIPNGRPKK
jgi:hypothetical protein